MNLMTTSGRGWEDSVFLPPFELRDFEKRECCAPAWVDQIAAILELQEAMRAIGDGDLSA